MDAVEMVSVMDVENVSVILIMSGKIVHVAKKIVLEMMKVSMVTVVEFHRVSGKIQWIFVSQIFKGFFDTL